MLDQKYQERLAKWKKIATEEEKKPTYTRGIYIPRREFHDEYEPREIKK